MSAVKHPGAELWWAELPLADVRLRPMLSPVETARVDSFTSWADQARSLLAAALVRAVCGALLGLPPAEVPVERGCEECGRPHGRPRVALPGAPQLSVSHSGVLVVVAAHQGPVGIDVQRREDVPVGMDVDSWVRGEALVKAGLAPDEALVLPLSPPLKWYAGALALPRTYDGGRVREHHATEVLDDLRCHQSFLRR